MKDKLIQICMFITIFQVAVIPIIGAPIFLVDALFLDDALLGKLSEYTGGNTALGFFRFAAIYFSPLILGMILLNLPEKKTATLDK